jgi:hypothetical protein
MGAWRVDLVACRQHCKLAGFPASADRADKLIQYGKSTSLHGSYHQGPKLLACVIHGL